VNEHDQLIERMAQLAHQRETIERETRRANAAEAELREVAGELETVKAFAAQETADCIRLRADWEKATALAKEAYHYHHRLPTDFVQRLSAFLSATPSPPAEPAPSLVEQTARLEVISSHRDTLQEAWESAASQAVTPAERAVLDATGFFDELNLCALERSGHEVFAAAVRSLRAAREEGGR
jgi:hypothetical protein